MLLKDLKLLPILLLGTVHLSQEANILFFLGLANYSHRMVMWPLAEQLAARGHSVTFVHSYKPKKPNPKIQEFSPPTMAQFFKMIGDVDLLNLRLTQGRDAIRDFAFKIPEFGLVMCDAFLSGEETHKWIRTSQFDLVVIDGLFNDCGYGLAELFGAKTIIFGTSHFFPWFYDSFGIVPESAWIPDPLTLDTIDMSFKERLDTAISHLMLHYIKQTDYFPKVGNLFKEKLGLDHALDIAEAERKTSLIFTASHFSEEYARSLPPMVVHVGGIHCEDSSQNLTKELQTFIDGSGEEGFIYVSFGSFADISKAPQEFQDAFFTAFRNTKTRIVWKFDGERTDKISSNVFIGKWMPQQAILAHPKIKAFLTHGGLLGTQEAVWHGVPLIVMPFFAEQDYNGLRVEHMKRGLLLEPKGLTAEKLEAAIRAVSTDPIYKKNMKELSVLFRDRPEKPVDTAVWWTEYVLRHDNLESLKPLGINQSWYKRRLLDVYAFMFAVILTVLLSIAVILYKVLAFFMSTKGYSSRMENGKKVN